MTEPDFGETDDLTREAAPGELGAGSSEFDDPVTLGREDLTSDGMLRGCSYVEYEGERTPTAGDYPLLRRIGRGGMGVVYAGVHPRLRTAIAVKVMRPDASALDPNLRARFLREARLAARLSTRSPHLVLVYDVNVDPPTGAYYLVMEYIHGVSASEWLRSVRRSAALKLSEQQALDLCIAATAGLATAHKAGVIHRDVKPGNVMIPFREGVVDPTQAKLTDLGLARMEEKSVDLTMADVATLGTPGFAAPEQLEGSRKARKPADVFAMGATLYELLTGDLPYPAAGAMARVVATLTGQYVPARERRSDVSEAVATLLDACLDRDPEKRYRDAPALLEALQICRAALGPAGDGVVHVTSQVADLVRKSEVGKIISSSGTRLSAAAQAGGTLVLEGGPPGASVHLRRDGDADPRFVLTLDDQGRAQADAVDPGRYVLDARHDDHENFRSRVTLRAGGETHFLLGMRARAGFLAVDSSPRGAMVRIGGDVVGRTPVARLRLRAGDHALVLEREGHGRVRRTVRIRSGRMEDLGVVELPATGETDLSGFDAELRFELGGEQVEHGQEVLAGSHQLVVVRPGFAEQRLDVDVPAGRPWRPELGPWRPGPWALVRERSLWCAADDGERRRVGRMLAAKLSGFEFVGLQRARAEDSGQFVAAFRHAGTGLQFALVPGDRFDMGSAPHEIGRRSDERLHPVSLGPYLLAMTAVSQGAWKRVTSENPSKFRGEDLPVESVSWKDCTAFCRAARLELPTEAQWEYAARGLRATSYSFGDDPLALPQWGWFADNADGHSRPVTGRPPNALGLRGMHGGVWEWCWDGYTEYPFNESLDPRGAESAPYRVFRGGSWTDGPPLLRSAARGAYRPDHRAFDVGLRPAYRLEPAHLGEPAGGVSQSSVGQSSVGQSSVGQSGATNP